VSRLTKDATEGEVIMVKGIVKVVGGVVAIGISIFAAIAAAGLAGDGLEEAFGGPDKESEAAALRKAS
jgi:hypothetical protein